MARVRIRRTAGGTYWIPRPDAEAEKAMDRKHVRTAPGALQWVTRDQAKGEALAALLLARMDAQDENIMGWLAENDPAAWIRWQELCQGCPTVRYAWAVQVIKTLGNEDLKKMLSR